MSLRVGIRYVGQEILVKNAAKEGVDLIDTEENQLPADYQPEDFQNILFDDDYINSNPWGHVDETIASFDELFPDNEENQLREVSAQLKNLKAGFVSKDYNSCNHLLSQLKVI